MVNQGGLNFLICSAEQQKNSQLWGKPVSEMRYCIFDLETTGLYPAYDEIIDFAYVIVQNEKIIAEGSYLVKTSIKISDSVKKLTGIKENDLEKASSLEEVLSEVRDQWERNNVELLVSHNLKNFDFPFLNKAWQRVFSEKIRYLGIDTLPLARVFIPGKKSYSLEKLSSQGRDKIEQVHRAFEDTLLLKTLFERITKLLKEQKLST